MATGTRTSQKGYAQFRTMLFDCCRTQADVAANVPMDLPMLGQGKKGKGDKKGKRKANAKASDYFAGCCFGCTASGRLLKDTASLEIASTAASQRDSTITGMLVQSDDCSAANLDEFLIDS